MFMLMLLMPPLPMLSMPCHYAIARADGDSAR